VHASPIARLEQAAAWNPEFRKCLDPETIDTSVLNNTLRLAIAGRLNESAVGNSGKSCGFCGGSGHAKMLHSNPVML
jgi:hypothetical protein